MKHRRGYASFASRTQSRVHLAQPSKHRAHNRWTSLSGALGGISFLSLMFANSISGTHAFVQDELHSPTNGITDGLTAAKHFPNYDQRIALETEQAAQLTHEAWASSLVAVEKVKQTKTTVEAEPWLIRLQDSVARAQDNLQTAKRLNEILVQIANEDLQDYRKAQLQLTRESPAQNLTRWITAYERAVGWSSSAASRSAKAVEVASAAAKNAQDCVKVANDWLVQNAMTATEPTQGEESFQ